MDYQRLIRGSFMSAMIEHNPKMVQEEHFDSDDDTSCPCQDENFELNLNFGGKGVTVKENKLLDNNDSLELGLDAEDGHEGTWKGSHYTEKNVAFVVSQMLRIAAECHLQGLVHHDMKLKN
ncbi:putative non-specific serine/threonine protein kinase [Helianthus annuus]|nr:putative non-specific serine/threonine protein kinase [Helianthus annuus]